MCNIMFYRQEGCRTWWRYQTEPFSALLAFCAGIHRSPVNSPHKGQSRGALMFSFICTLDIRLSKQSWGWWCETPLRSLWRHCNEITLEYVYDVIWRLDMETILTLLMLFVKRGQWRGALFVHLLLTRKAFEQAVYCRSFETPWQSCDIIVTI